MRFPFRFPHRIDFPYSLGRGLIHAFDYNHITDQVTEIVP
ncbi:hypothetical protein PAMC26577_07700 [Caballeronia sordidicola]|uniref:Uncharacterized protein n=1 Tax=Caballeronia sordidicola TaxID=196367 RepID=A0A242N1P9_CABSO|nr:hypothetical protein PAMC26577_07700 [Caballeronia sordidicola]